MSDSFVRLNEAADRHKKLDAEELEVGGQTVYQLRVQALGGGGSAALVPDLRMETVGGETFVGEAAPGSADSAPAWRIKKMLTAGSVFRIVWADGTSAYDKVWDDRATYTY